MKIIVNNLQELDEAAKQILNTHNNKRIFALIGSMGSGKTTLTKSFCKYLNVKDVVNSPTFSIINEYITEDNMYVYHFDCYRLKNLREFNEIGGEDYLYSGAYCFIEWADMIEDLLPEDTLKVFISVDEPTKFRVINC